MRKTLYHANKARLLALVSIALLICLLFAGCTGRPDDESAPQEIPPEVAVIENIFLNYNGDLADVADDVNLAVVNYAADVHQIHLYEYDIPAEDGSLTDKLYLISNPMQGNMSAGATYTFSLEPEQEHKFIVEVYGETELLCRAEVHIDAAATQSLQQLTVYMPDADSYDVSLEPWRLSQEPSADNAEMGFSLNDFEIKLGLQEVDFITAFGLRERSRESIVLEDEIYGKAHFVHCGDVELIYLSNNDDGRDYLAALWSTSADLTSYRGISPGMETEELLAEYVLSELGLSLAKSAYCQLRFDFDDGYSYSLNSDKEQQIINFYCQDGKLSGIEFADYNLLQVLPLGLGDGQLETELYQAYFLAASRDDEAARAKVFELLPKANWQLYNAPVSTNQTDARMDLFTWLWGLEELNEAELTAILQVAAGNIDGAYAEGFGYYYAEQFRAQPQFFLAALSNLSSSEQAQLINLLAIELYLSVETPWQNELTDLSDSQQKLVQRLQEKGEQYLLKNSNAPA